MTVDHSLKLWNTLLEGEAMILVTGGTGTAGAEVVRALVGSGRHVRLLARDTEKAQRLFGAAVEIVAGDFADARSVDRALADADELFLSCADDPRRVAWETRTVDAASASGVRRVVKLSSIGAQPGSPVPFWDWHGRVERHLRESPVSAVILRSNFYMSNIAPAGGRIHAPAGDARIAMIDPRDVGAAAAAVVGDTGHDGRTYLLTGPEAITYAQAAAELSAEYVDVPDAEARKQLPGEVADLFARLRAGVAEQVTADVETLTGRPARDFRSFAGATAGAAR
jgi:uncharacterized protein YbjT (DUF2867 family)